MHVDIDLLGYFLSDAMSWNVVTTHVIFGKKNAEIFWWKSERFSSFSIFNKFMKMYSNTISIVHSNFRRKEPLYLFIQALFLSGTDIGFRDLLFSLLSPAKNIASTTMRPYFGIRVFGDYSVTIELWMRFHLPVIDWKGRSFLLLRYQTGRRRIEWEVWRWISTPRAGQGSKPGQ